MIPSVMPTSTVVFRRPAVRSASLLHFYLYIPQALFSQTFCASMMDVTPVADVACGTEGMLLTGQTSIPMFGAMRASRVGSKACNDNAPRMPAV